MKFIDDVNTMLCPIIFNSKTIELTVRTFYWVLDLLCDSNPNALIQMRLTASFIMIVPLKGVSSSSFIDCDSSTWNHSFHSSSTWIKKP